MSMKFKNNAGSKLAGVLTSDATTITVLTGTGANFPSISSDKDYFHATIVGDNGDMEIVRVTAVSGDTLTVIRAQEDTTAKEWPANTRIENRITAEFLNMAVTGGDGGVTYIDEDKDIDTLLTPGLYVTRNGRFINAPINMIINDGSVAENTYKYIPVLGIDEIGDILIVYTDTKTSKIRQAFYSVVLPAGVFRTIGSNAGDKYWGFSKSAYASTEAGTMGNVFADGTTIKADSFGFISVVTDGLKATSDKLGTVKPDGTTITISDDGTISVANGVEVDDVTIKKNASGVISVKPEGIIDNNTVVLDKDGKISTKSIPFEGGSIFAVLAGNNEGSFTNEGDGINNQQQRPNLGDSSFQKSQDGRSFCHIDNNAIVLDEDGFYIVRLRRAFYPDVSNTNEMDLTESISYKPVGSAAFSNIGTQTLRMNNDPDLWQYCDFSIVLHGKAGDAISTLSYEPVVASVKIYSGSFGLYVFKIPVTNEYQINSSELNTYSKSNFTVPNPNSSPNLFDPGDFLTSSNVYTGTTFTEKTEDGFVKVLESGVYVISHYINVIINSSDGNTYDMPHGVMIIKDGPTYDYVMQSTVTVRSNAITNDADEVTGLIYLSAGEVIAPFIYAPTSIYNPIKIESSNLRIVKLAAASQITHNHSAYKTITLTNEDNIDNLKPGSYYCPTGITPQGTFGQIGKPDGDWVLLVFGDGSVVNNSFKQILYTYFTEGRLRIREYDSGWTDWRYSVGKASTEFLGIVNLATQEQVTAGTEAGAYAVTPALVKAAVETFAPTIVNNTINSSESTLHQTIQNMIDASTPEVTPESFTGILPIAKGGTGNATGKATTATKLATARTITVAGDATGSASFDGSANATITVDVVNATNAVNATKATTATKLATARTITVAGDATGSASFDGSANATITVDVVNATNAVNATKATTATKWSGSTKYVSTAAASGGVNGDIWFQYI